MKNLTKSFILLLLTLIFLPKLDSAVAVPNSLNAERTTLKTLSKPSFFEKMVAHRFFKKINRQIGKTPTDPTTESLALENKANQYGTWAVICPLLAVGFYLLAIQGLTAPFLLIAVMCVALTLFFATSAIKLSKQIEVRRAKKDMAKNKGCCGLMMGLGLLLFAIFAIIAS